MTFLTSFALRRPTVTLLTIILVLAGGVFSYRSMQVELFPQIEFPLVTVIASYPSADPEAVVRDVTEPIEWAISGAGRAGDRAVFVVGGSGDSARHVPVRNGYGRGPGTRRECPERRGFPGCRGGTRRWVVSTPTPFR